MRLRTILMMIAIAGSAIVATAALSPEKAAWAKGPAQYLMTPDEVRQWNALQTDAEADAFIAHFWERRDPRAREVFEGRVATADKTFSNGRMRGSMTDRGRIFIVFGPPTHATHTGGRTQMEAPGSVEGTGEQTTQPGNAMPRSTWTYDGEIAEKIFGAPHVEFRFSDRLGNGDERLEPTKVDVAAAQEKVVNSLILPEAPKKVQTVTVRTPETAPPTTLKTAALETAINDAKSGKVESKGATITYAEFVSPAGEHYVPVGFFVPAAAGFSADSADTFFGVIEDSAGKRVAVVEQPAKPFMDRNNALYDYTANLPAGHYTAIFGLAKGGVPVVVTSAPLQVNPLAKDAEGVSALIVGDVVETMEAAPVKAPFQFGKLKLVPRTQFTNKDDLNFFIEVHNPGIDAATNAPKLQAKLELLDSKGTVLAALPLAEAVVGPLAPNATAEWAYSSGIPLSRMKTPLKAGDYTLRVKLIDTVTKTSHTVEQKFKIIG